MKIEIDGKEVEVQNDIKIIYDDVPMFKDCHGHNVEVCGQLHITVRSEGITIDKIEDDECFDVAWLCLDDLSDLASH